eukprot:2686953-Pleurochrysis_carterae.AAC.1
MFRTSRMHALLRDDTTFPHELNLQNCGAIGAHASAQPPRLVLRNLAGSTEVPTCSATYYSRVPYRERYVPCTDVDFVVDEAALMSVRESLRRKAGSNSLLPPGNRYGPRM